MDGSLLRIHWLSLSYRMVLTRVLCSIEPPFHLPMGTDFKLPLIGTFRRLLPKFHLIYHYLYLTGLCNAAQQIVDLSQHFPRSELPYTKH